MENQAPTQQFHFTGQPLDRVDGRLKVTGAAKYAAEFALPNLAHGVVIESTIANGRIKSFDTSEMEKSPGFISVITPMNIPALGRPSTPPSGIQHPLLTEEISYSGQLIGIVVAETWEQAEHAASLAKVDYDEKKPEVTIADRFDQAFSPNNGQSNYKRGDVSTAASVTKIDEVYHTPSEHHNPMEPHATVAMWQDDDHLLLYEATQGVTNSQNALAATFGLPPKNVRVVDPFVGGGFGCKGQSWPHARLAALAAKVLKRPVKVVLSRKQMFSSNGHREETFQHNVLGTDSDGKLNLLKHEMHGHTSIHESFNESTGSVHKMLYSCANVDIQHNLIRCNVGAPTYMRAPGEAPGSFALETAMDELAIALKVDPLELRLKNYAEKDESENKPFSSKSLRECYKQAADAFGWSKRNPVPGSMRDGRTLIGYGMASATYPGNFWGATARARMDARGHVLIQVGSQDLGTGTYTILSQIAADAVGVHPSQVTVELADTNLPPGPLSAGSNSAASVGSTILVVGQALRAEILGAWLPLSGGVFGSAAAADIDAAEGHVFVRSDPSKKISYEDVVKKIGKPVEKEASSSSGQGPGGIPATWTAGRDYSKHAFGAQFCEIHIDPDLRMMRVARWVGAFAVGRILNEKTLRSQLQGGIVWGIGMGLLEESVLDVPYGRYVNSNLAEYHLPVNRDVPDIQIVMVPEDDPYVSPIGSKGAGEIGITGAAAAICNAVYNATGKRVRDLPITLDKIM